MVNVEEETCMLCPRLVASRNRIVHGVGLAPARIMLVGQSPARQGSDKTGKPFTSPRSGKLLDEALVESGISRDDVYITNAIRCAPPDDDTQITDEEISNCRKHLDREISKVKPVVIVALGQVASKALMADNTSKRSYSLKHLCFIECIGHPSYYIRSGMPQTFKDRIKEITESYAKTERQEKPKDESLKLSVECSNCGMRAAVRQDGTAACYNCGVKSRVTQ